MVASKCGWLRYYFIERLGLIRLSRESQDEHARASAPSKSLSHNEALKYFNMLVSG